MTDEPKRKTLRYRRQPNAKGLAGVAQGILGWDLVYGDDTVGRVRPTERSGANWYFSARDDGLGVPLINTASHGYTWSAEDAKAACRDYVAGYIKGGKS